MGNMNVFTETYNRNQFHQISGKLESISGSGSSLDQTRTLRAELAKLIKDYKIKSILDIPCGDWNWMREVDLTGIDYIGADIVKSLISRNTLSYPQSFRVLDITKDELPKSDLVIVRDCFVHFSDEDIFRAIANIKQSGSKYLLSTSFASRTMNTDIPTGQWRALNLMIYPFGNIGLLKAVINEGCTEGNSEYADKSMVLWKI
jgi:hypothetical protein